MFALTLAYHHERMRHVYNVDLWTRGKIYRVFDIVLCLGHSFFVYWKFDMVIPYLARVYTLEWCVGYIHARCHKAEILPIRPKTLSNGSVNIFMTLTFGLYQNYIFTMNFCLCKLWHRLIKFGIWAYHHETFIICITLTFDLLVYVSDGVWGGYSLFHLVIGKDCRPCTLKWEWKSWDFIMVGVAL